jgi:beta-glucanase (GH16 family)
MAFETDGGMVGVKRTSTRLNKKKLPLTSFHYLLREGERTVAVTCTSAAAVYQTYEPIFDQTMSTLAFTQTGGGNLPEGYERVWAEEFDQDGRPNPENWTFEQGFVRNRELQWYQPENAFVEHGKLIIEARREQKPNPNHNPQTEDWRQNRKTIEYTSACLKTMGLHSWQYGRFEVRARIKAEAGLWPAIWFLGVDGEWPSSGEIDLMEYYRGDILANACWGTEERWVAKWDTGKIPVASFGDPDWDEKFHVWRMDWDETSIRLYVDDQLLNTIDLAETINPTDRGPKNPFHQPHYLLLNLAIGGDNGGDPSGTDFPSRYEIDYVRVYQKRSADL